MNRKHFFTVMAASILSAFLGGLLANRIFKIEPAFAQSSQNVVKARSFRVVGENGRTKALLGVASSGGSILQMYDDSGNERVYIVANRKGVRLILSDQNRKHRLVMDDRPVLRLNTRRADENPIVLYNDEEGKKKHFGAMAYIRPLSRLPQRNPHKIGSTKGERDKSEVTDSDITALWSKIDEIVMTLNEVAGRQP